MKELSINVKELTHIARGASADIYSLDDERILKVYFPGFDLSFVEAEFNTTQKVLKAGVNTMIAFEIVKVGNCYGAIFERLNSKDLLGMMREDRENLEKYVSDFGTFVRESHEILLDPKDFEDGRDIILSDLVPGQNDLTQTEYNRIKEILDLLGERNNFSHGDCHAANVMMINKEYVFIDVGGASRCHPILDFVSMFNQFRLADYHGISDSNMTSPYAKIFSKEEREIIWNAYIRAASGIDNPTQLELLEKQISVIAAINMMHIIFRIKAKNIEMSLPAGLYEIIKKEIEDYYEGGLKPFLL